LSGIVGTSGVKAEAPHPERKISTKKLPTNLNRQNHRSFATQSRRKRTLA
jgi:hypothetical protein